MKISLIAKIIDKLQHYLSEKGGKREKVVRLNGIVHVEQVPYPFFKWLETHYPHHIEPGGLWQRMIESLHVRYDGQRNPIDANLTTFVDNTYLNSQHSNRIV